MDLDAVIARKPALVLVDELAHTNVPGVRNEKRYQDVLELMAKGIDVFTTVNVQHLESFADTVEEIAGIAVHERIPDSVFDAADQVVLIDISPEELLKRLAEGKVYLGDAARAAMENFFKKSTLTALREMSLRYTALLVDHQLASYARESGRESPAKSGERLLVAISPSPNSAHLIRWTRQRAFSLKAEWTALFIETGQPLGDAAQETLRKNMNLARQLGAAVVSIPAEDVAETVLRYARTNNVSQIVLGKSGLSTRRGAFTRRSVTDRILAGSGDIDVAVVQEKGTTVVHTPTRLATAVKSQAGRFSVSLAVVAAVTGINLLALPEVGYHTVSILYLLAVISIAFFATRAAVLVCAALSAVLWDYFFIPPRFTFAIEKLEDALMIILYFVTAAALAFLMSRLRSNQRMLAVRERRVTLLYNFSLSLSILHSIPEIVQTSIERISRYFEAECILFLRDSETSIERTVRSLAAVQIDDKEFGVAQWCFANRTPCGKYTDTLAFAGFHYIPLLTPDSTVGVMGIRLPEGRAWPHDQDAFLQTLGRNLSLSDRERAPRGRKQEKPHGPRIGEAGQGAPQFDLPRASHAAHHHQGLGDCAHGFLHGGGPRGALGAARGDPDGNRPAELHRREPPQHEPAGVGNAAPEEVHERHLRPGLGGRGRHAQTVTRPSPLHQDRRRCAPGVPRLHPDDAGSHQHPRQHGAPYPAGNLRGDQC